MSEKLELMKQIYELSGVDPDMWFGENPQNDYWTLNRYTLLEELGNPTEVELDKPWYPLEQCLRELPEKITKEESYLVYGCEENFCDVNYDLGMNKKGLGYLVDKDQVLFWEPINNDYHTAALKLWLKVLEGEKDD